MFAHADGKIVFPAGCSFLLTAKSFSGLDDRLRQRRNRFPAWMIVYAGGEIIFPFGRAFLPAAKLFSAWKVVLPKA
jgi:hypothetical protein